MQNSSFLNLSSPNVSTLAPNARSTFREELDVLLRKCVGDPKLLDSRFRGNDKPLAILWASGLVFFTAFLIFFFSVAFAEEIRYDTGDRRDPFVPLVGEGGLLATKSFSSNGLNIEGIIFDPAEGSMVLIDGDLYKQGDHVQNADIVHIFNDRVILSQDSEEKTIWIREEIIQEGQKKYENAPKPKSKGGVVATTRAAKKK